MYSRPLPTDKPNGTEQIKMFSEILTEKISKMFGIFDPNSAKIMLQFGEKKPKRCVEFQPRIQIDSRNKVQIIQTICQKGWANLFTSRD